MMNTLYKVLASSGLLASMGVGSIARAEMFDFGCITDNSAVNCQTGALQLSVEVLSGPGGQAQFVFRNNGPAAASITDVYFDDGTLLGIASIANGAGVDFSQDANPSNLPGGNLISPAFETTAGFSADSNPPVQSNGVNPGETVTIYFSLQSGGTIADVISELYSRELRIGLRVQGFASGGGESFVNEVLPVPLPAAGWLMLSGLGALRVMRRRNAIVNGTSSTRNTA
jgi:hypothetical protein